MENLTVSDLFKEIYLNFNVTKQSEKIKNLTRKELLLLLILSIDNFNEENPIVIENFSEFTKELELIYNSLPDLDEDVVVTTTDPDLLDLISLTGDKYINVSKLVDTFGQKLPEPLTDEEAKIKRREIGIENLLDNSK
jgi:hypothetical protein